MISAALIIGPYRAFPISEFSNDRSQEILYKPPAGIVKQLKKGRASSLPQIVANSGSFRVAKLARISNIELAFPDNYASKSLKQESHPKFE